MKAQARPLDGDRSEAGFTLIETLIAIVLLIFGLIAVANLFLVATSSNTTANFSTAATTQATEVMERLKAIPFNNVVAGGDLNSDAGALVGCVDSPVQDCVIPGNFNSQRDVPGVGRIKVRWVIVSFPPTRQFVAVRSEGESILFRGRTRAEFTTFRTPR